MNGGFPRNGRRAAARLMLSALACAALTAAQLTFGAPVGGVRADKGTGGSHRASTEPNQPCLDCHGQGDMSMTFPSGEALSLQIEPAQYEASVHGGRLDCLDCHERTRDYPHPPTTVGNRRDYALAEYETCKQCHFAEYTRSRDSVHFDAMAAGNADAAICTDCHDAHTVTSLKDPRTEVARTCASCHSEIYEAMPRVSTAPPSARTTPTCPIASRAMASTTW